MTFQGRGLFLLPSGAKTELLRLRRGARLLTASQPAAANTRKHVEHDSTCFFMPEARRSRKNKFAAAHVFLCSFKRRCAEQASML